MRLVRGVTRSSGGGGFGGPGGRRRGGGRRSDGFRGNPHECGFRGCGPPGINREAPAEVSVDLGPAAPATRVKAFGWYDGGGKPPPLTRATHFFRAGGAMKVSRT